MIENQGFIGTKLMTADGAVGVEGKPTRVYHIAILSGAAAGVVQLLNGTSASSTVYARETCTVVSTSNHFDYGPEGILFPSGLMYAEVVDANVDSTLIAYSQEA